MNWLIVEFMKTIYFMHYLRRVYMRRLFFKSEERKFLSLFLSLTLILSSLVFVGQTSIATAITIPGILITEMLPNPTIDSSNTADAYEYIELYNNSDSSIDLKDYKLLYIPNNTKWDLTTSKIVAPKSTVVIWVQTSDTPASISSADNEWDYFNAHYGVNVPEDERYILERKTSTGGWTSGLANSGSRGIILYRDDQVSDGVNQGICKAEYIGDTHAPAKLTDKSIVYDFPVDGYNMRLASFGQNPTPGTLTDGQLPDSGSLDTIPPVITHTQEVTSTEPVDLKISVVITDNNTTENATLFYKTPQQGKYDFLTMKQNPAESTIYEAAIPASFLRDTLSLEYYIQATDGVNTSVSQKYTAAVIDVIQPSVSALAPGNDRYVIGDQRPVISASYSDLSCINTASVKLFVDDIDVTGKAVITGTKISYTPDADLEVGMHTIKLLVPDNSDAHNTSETLWTFEITLDEGVYNIYFGQIHSHSAYSDGQGTPDQAYTWARDMGHADFFSLTDHSNHFDSDLDWENSQKWADLKAVADKYNVDGQFTAFGGYEMTWGAKSAWWGHMNTFNTDWFESSNNLAVNLPEYYKKLIESPGSISQFNHPGDAFGDFEGFGYYSEEADNAIPLFEIKYPDHYTNYIRALDKGWHVAPTNNQDNHSGNWVTYNDTRTVALAHNLTRADIYDAFRNMRVYSSEDKNIRVVYEANGNIMGSILDNPRKLDIHVDINDPDKSDKISKVSVIANGGIVVASENFDSNTVLKDWELDPTYNYYFIEIIEADGQRVITAPVWTEKTASAAVNLNVSRNQDTSKGTNNISATVTNNGEFNLPNINITFYKDSVSEANKIGETAIHAIQKGQSETASINWTPDGGNYTIIAEASVSLTGVKKKYVGVTVLPELLITELMANPVSDPAAPTVDDYEYIEVYNNTSEPINIKNYKVVYYSGTGDTYVSAWDITDDKIIEPGKLMVIWVKRAGSTKTIADFNAQYSTSLTDADYCTVTGSLDNSGSTKLTSIVKDSAKLSDINQDDTTGQIVKVKYDDGLDLKQDTPALEGKSINYDYSTDGSNMMKKIASGQEPTPGILVAGQLFRSSASLKKGANK
jgi:hypothetical protein